jgi:hypothetical protein
MTTFSQLVDDVKTELLRPDMTAMLASYANQTIRELHFRPGLNAPILYDANRYEEELAITTERTWLWTIPSSTRFQNVEAIFINDLGIYLQPKNPRIALEPSFQPFADRYWYRSGATIALQGVATGWTGLMSYHMFPRTLAYKPASGAGARLIRFDPDTDSYVLIVGGGEPSEAQLELETHWLLQRWGDTVKEGVRAKAYKRLGDMDRTRISFSAFESMRSSVWNTEPAS